MKCRLMVLYVLGAECEAPSHAMQPKLDHAYAQVILPFKQFFNHMIINGVCSWKAAVCKICKGSEAQQSRPAAPCYVQ